MKRIFVALLFGAFFSLIGAISAHDIKKEHDPRLAISPLDWYKDRSRVNPPSAFSACIRQYSYQENAVIACEFGVKAYCESTVTDPIESCVKECTSDGIGGSSAKQCFYGCWAAQEYGGCSGDS